VQHPAGMSTSAFSPAAEAALSALHVARRLADADLRKHLSHVLAHPDHAEFLRRGDLDAIENVMDQAVSDETSTPTRSDFTPRAATQHGIVAELLLSLNAEFAVFERNAAADGSRWDWERASAELLDSADGAEHSCTRALSKAFGKRPAETVKQATCMWIAELHMLADTWSVYFRGVAAVGDVLPPACEFARRIAAEQVPGLAGELVASERPGADFALAVRRRLDELPAAVARLCPGTDAATAAAAADANAEFVRLLVTFDVRAGSTAEGLRAEMAARSEGRAERADAAVMRRLTDAQRRVALTSRRHPALRRGQPQPRRVRPRTGIGPLPRPAS